VPLVLTVLIAFSSSSRLAGTLRFFALSDRYFPPPCLSYFFPFFFVSFIRLPLEVSSRMLPMGIVLVSELRALVAFFFFLCSFSSHVHFFFSTPHPKTR